jgi:hypothetical protein
MQTHSPFDLLLMGHRVGLLHCFKINMVVHDIILSQGNTNTHPLWKKWVFCNWPCNSIFELQRTLVTHYIYTLSVLMDKLHELQSCNSPYIRCNSLQFNCNSIKISNHYTSPRGHVDVIDYHPSIKI